MAKSKIRFHRILAGLTILLVVSIKPLVAALPIFIGISSIALGFVASLVLRTREWANWKQKCEEGLTVECRQPIVALVRDGFLVLRLPSFPDRILYSTKVPPSMVDTFTALLADGTNVFGYLSTSWPEPVAIEVGDKFIALSPWFEKTIFQEVQDSKTPFPVNLNCGARKCFK